MEINERKIIRSHQILPQVVFVGGHPGCGKTMLTPILGSMNRVEIQKYNYPMEYMAQLEFLGKMTPDSATAMVRMLLDIDIYNMSMSREVNFRYSDLSSVFQNPNPWRYFKRSIGKGDEVVLAKIKTEKPILQIVTHNLLALSQTLFNSLGERMTVLEVIRHPLYMLKQWFLYVERYGTDVRDFTIWFEYQGKQLPFFAKGWEEKFLNCNSMDRVIYSISQLAQMGGKNMAQLSPTLKDRILFIPFERFVLNPYPFIDKIENLLNTQRTPATIKELKRQKVPRQKVADGISLPIYKLNGWQSPKQGSSEKEELQSRWAFAKEKASPEGLALLKRMCDTYEEENVPEWKGFIDEVYK
ncbi:MAG: hypothetical protein ACKVQC_00370 [Elusimicrobiota bacterium]